MWYNRRYDLFSQIYVHLILHDFMEKGSEEWNSKNIFSLTILLFGLSGKRLSLSSRKLFANPTVKYVRNEAAWLKDLLKGKASKGFSIYALNFCQLNQRRMYSHLTFYMNSRKRDQTSEDSKSHFLFAEQSSFLLRLFAKILFYGHSTKYDFRSDRDGPTSLLSGSWKIPHKNVR